jgi:hypothetical protein
MRLIRKKEIKFVKLLLISPYLELSMNLLYLISLPLIIFKFLHMPNNITNFEINTLARTNLNQDQFKNITTPKQYINYIEDLLKTLYAPNKIPTFIPIGAIRLKRFSTIQNCNIRCSYPDPLELEPSCKMN